MIDILTDMEKENIYDSYKEVRDEKEIAEARRKKRIRFVGVGIAVLVVLSLLVGSVSAFEDTSEYHLNDNLSDVWTTTGSASIVNYPAATHQKAIHVYGSGSAVMKYPSPSDYWSLNSYGGYSNAYYHVQLYVIFYNSTMVNICQKTWSNSVPSGLWELKRETGNFYWFIDGVSQGVFCACAETPSYIGFSAGSDAFRNADIKFDDITNIQIGVTDISADKNNANGYPYDNCNHTLTISDLYPAGVPDNDIDVGYTLQTITNYESSEYKLNVKRLLTGEIINTTIVKEAGNGSVTPHGIITYNRTKLFGDNYGFYSFYLTKDGAMYDDDYIIWRKLELGGESWITFDKDVYVAGATAQVEHYLDSPNFADYTYAGVIIGATTGKQKDTWSISAASGTENIDLAGYDAGTYYALIKMHDKSSGNDYEIAYDIMNVNEEIIIEGITYNAETEVILGIVNASFLQGTQYYNATSDTSTGEYNVSGLSVDIETDVNATKTNYTHNDFSFTPLQVDLYEVDIFMLPNISHISYHNTSIGGLVQSSPFYQNVSGATVNIWNASWSNSTTANTAGYYIFENLTNGTYSINATCAGYLASSDEEVETNNGSFLYHYILLQPQFILTIKASDASTHATITDFTALVNDDDVQDTTNGSIDFTVGYGIHKVEASAEGYYASLEYVYVDEDTEKIMYLTPLEGAGGTGTYYPPPHLVEFRVQDNWGNPYSNVVVTAVGIETTMTTWDMIKSLFGLGNMSVQNETMSGTTDSNGGISFMMVEVVKYEMTFIKGSEVNETIYIYPKEDHYKIIIGNEGWVQTTSMWDVINYSILASELNDTHEYINFSYVDTNNKTSELYYFVNQSNGTTTFNIYNHTYTGGDCANITNSYIVERGEAYLIGFEADNDEYGEIKHSLFIRIFEKDKRLLEFEGVPAYIYTYLSIGLLMLVGAFFGMITVPEGGIVICLEAWILWFVGWFLWENPLAPLYLTVATVFAILIIFANKGRQKGVS